MADNTTPTRSGPNWLWILLLVLLAILAIVWLASPSGDTDDTQVEDPIVTPEMAEPEDDVQVLVDETGQAGTATGATGNEVQPIE